MVFHKLLVWTGLRAFIKRYIYGNNFIAFKFVYDKLCLDLYSSFLMLYTNFRVQNAALSDAMSERSRARSAFLMIFSVVLVSWWIVVLKLAPIDRSGGSFQACLK